MINNRHLSSLMLFIAALLLVITFTLQPQRITGNDATIHCDVQYETIKQDENPYIYENWQKYKIQDTTYLIRMQGVGFNNPPIFTNLFEFICSNEQVNWKLTYPYIAVFSVIFSIIALTIINMSDSIFKNSLILITLFNGFYQSIRSGNISIFAVFLIVCTALLIHYERPIAAGALFGVYAIFRMTPLFILPIYFFFGNKYFVRKFTLGAGLSVASSFIYSLIFQFEYLIYWIVRVVLPESFEKYFNVEEITGLRIASNIYNDTFDFPTIWNIFNELSINQRLIPVLAFIFFFVVMYKLRSIDINNQLLAFCISYLVYYVVTPYNRPYHLLEVSFILIVFLSLGNINKLGVVTFASVIYPGFILLKYLDYIIFPDALVHFMYVSPVLCCISLLFYTSIKRNNTI